MPRYFFHTRDGAFLSDKEGSELADLAAAKKEAVRLLGETLWDNPDHLWETSSFSVIVVDDGGLTLFRLDLVASLAPAAGGGAR